VLRRQNITCPKLSTRYEYNAGEVEDTILSCNCCLNHCAKNYSIQLQFDDAMLNCSGLCFFVNTLVNRNKYSAVAMRPRDASCVCQ